MRKTKRLLTSAQLIESVHSESGGRDTDYNSISLLSRKSVASLLTTLCVFALGAALLAGCRTTTPSLRGKALPSAAPELLASDISFDNETGEIKYTLPEAALVRIRIGIKDGGALLRNLVDWEPRGAGPHTEVWDHKDASGAVDFKGNTELFLTLSCLPADPVKRKAYKGIIKGFRPAPKLKIVFPQSAPGPTALSPDGQAGLPALTGVVPVRVLIDPEDNRWLVETKYELGLFIDNVFLAEDEEGVNPYTYTFNTKGLNDGPHIITANIVGYEGEVGTESVVVMVENKK